MCCLQSIAKRDYQEIVTTGQTDKQTDAGLWSLLSLCFAGNFLKKDLLLACMIYFTLYSAILVFQLYNIIMVTISKNPIGCNAL